MGFKKAGLVYCSLLIMLLSSSIVGCGGDNTESNSISATGTADHANTCARLTIEAEKIIQDENHGTALVYSVNNPNAEQVIYKEDLHVSLTDDDGEVLFRNTGGESGSLYATQSLVPPNGKYEFVYYIFGIGEATRAEVKFDQKCTKISAGDIPEITVTSLNAVPCVPSDNECFPGDTEQIEGSLKNESEVTLDVQINIIARENDEIAGAVVTRQRDVTPGEQRNFNLPAIGSFIGKDITVNAVPLSVPALENNNHQ